ncbi:MAG: tetratricopeptide repeat protein [bacterium]|nr:tetratricopeptide repeat protein [bacterium]
MRYLFLTALVFIVYFNALGNGFVSDDRGIISSSAINNIEYFLPPPYFNANIRAVLIFFTNQVFGLNPFFFRLPNILAHLGSVFVIYFIVRKLSGKLTAIFAAAVFAVHPILTEGVTWISGGGYSLYTFFILASFYCYLKESTRKYYLISVFLFYLSLLSSEKAIIFPLILFIYELALGNLKTNWRKLIPFFFLSFFWGLYLLGMIGTRIGDLQTSYGGVQERLNPLVQIPIAITSYLQLIFWPDGLTLYHSEMFFGQTEYLTRLGIFLLFIAGIIFSFFKNRVVFFWLSFFIISLLPTLTPLGISWIVAERYVYLGTIGIIVIFAMLIKKVAILVKNDDIFWGALIIIIILFSIRTMFRNADWTNEDTLWLSAARTSPSSSQNHNNLGDYYGRQGDLKRSAEEFQAAIKLNPQYADAYHNLGNAYRDMGNLDLAIENYQKALSFNPNLWQSYYNIAAIYYYQKKYPESEDFLSKAKKLNPEIQPFTKKL